MNGIDTGSGGALLANRVSSLNPIGGQGSAGTVQTGVSALATGTGALPDAQTADANAAASAQTVLSAVALALDAIIRSGGEATPAVVGDAPVWADPDAAGAAAQGSQGAAQSLMGLAAEAARLVGGDLSVLADSSAAGAAGSDEATNAAPSGQPSQATGASAASAAAQGGVVAALAASLQQTVAGSGLFYESHLAQWLLGQRTPAMLAGEPQNRLTGGDVSQPAGWSRASDDATDVLWAGTDGARGLSAGHADGSAGLSARYTATSGDALLLENDGRAEASLAARATLSSTGQDGAASMPGGVSIHSAVIPLVRQQLDLLATGEFRWMGEAWPGVRLDWSIEQERVEARDGREGRGGDPADAPWRTRLTLALPSLGTVDAELTLSGASLAVRVQANPGGAARLVAGSDTLRNRLEALGLALTGLAIREIGGAAGPGEAAKAAHAYARAAAAQDARTHAPGAAGSGDLDWDL